MGRILARLGNILLLWTIFTGAAVAHVMGPFITLQEGLPHFNSIYVGGDFTINIKTNKSPALSVKAREGILPYLKSYVSNGKLYIGYNKRMQFRNKKEFTIDINVRRLKKLVASGNYTVVINNISGGQLMIRATGKGQLHLAGKLNKLRLELTQDTDVYADQLKVVNASVKSSGAAKIKLHVTGVLNKEISPQTRLEVVGHPTIKVAQLRAIETAQQTKIVTHQFS